MTGKIKVPILTQSEDWALSEPCDRLLVALEVPILTQSEDWALLLVYAIHTEIVVPILTQSEDWALLKNVITGDPIDIVPILTQSEDWALFASARLSSVRAKFQSSPSPKTGRY